MAITFLQAVNRTLVKLRESEVSTLNGSSDYVKLIAAYVNEVKEEVETAWTWSYLRTSVDITTVNGTSNYAITGAGEEFIIESVWDITNSGQLLGPSPNILVDTGTIQSTFADSGQATHFDVMGMDANGDQEIRLYPTPTTDGITIRVYGRKKQAYLETSADDNTLIKLPWKPVVFGAYVKALSERGEDGGAIYDEAVKSYYDAMSTAIALDARNNHVNLDWYED